MTRILLARHGETEWNALGRIQGWTESPLNELGRTQAESLGTRLSAFPLAAIYSSDLSRAMDTAEAAAMRQGLDVQPMPQLREKNFGRWEGLTAEDVARDYPDDWRRYHVMREWDASIPGGEAWADVQARILAALNQVLAAHPAPEDTVLLVGHGGSLRLVILEALNAALPTLLHLHLSNASLSRLDFDSAHERSGRVLLLNDTSHLQGRDE